MSADVPTLLDAYELRAVVDGLAARLAAGRSGNRSARQLAELVAEQRRVLEAWDPSSYTSLNVAFHEQIMYLSGNPYVIGQLPILRLTAQVFTPFELVEQPTAVRAVGEHAEIADAIAAGDSAAAERLARSHIEHTANELRRRTAQD